MQQYLIDEHPIQGPAKIDSVQNGLLLWTGLHPYFDAYGFSIHPVLLLLLLLTTKIT